MSPRPPATIPDVVDAHLCTGCGVCAYLEPESYRMVDVPDVGRRPLPIAAVNGRPSPGVRACPGRALPRPAGRAQNAPLEGLWGPVLAVYECWSTDPVLRHRGSSGGVISALSAHAVASGLARGALQVRASPETPMENEVVLSTTREDIVSAAGSRYSPASPAAHLDLVEDADGPCVVVGKPCDIAATRGAQGLRPRLDSNVGLTIAMFCAGTPSSRGTEKLVEQLGVAAQDVARLDYRGEGWPGRFRLRTRGGHERSLSYDEAWGHTLHRHRQWRCMVCPDHTGESADLSVGDPWYRPVAPDEPGRSLVIVRTERGRAALDAALEEGAVAGHEVPVERLPESQPHLASTQRAVWGRVLAMRLAGLPVPRFAGRRGMRLWAGLPLRQKVSSVAGTWRRIRVRGLRGGEVARPEVRVP